MKDLKENIQKNNMKKLVLSVVLGMFCYCTNNAAEQEKKKEEPQIKNIIAVLSNIILDQVNIFNAKEAIKEKGKKIYTTIKKGNEKVTKGNLLNFIKEQFKIETKELFTEGIEYLEQYFHLEKINENEECTKDNLTEIFWEEKEGGEAIDGVEDDITKYLIKIADSENNIRVYFQEYYQVKKAEKTQGGEEKKKEEIIDEIMKECYKGDENSDPNTKFLAKLEEICEEEEIAKQIGDEKDAILKTIQRRITLDDKITEKALKSFIKQKIVIEEEKEKEKKDSQKGDKPKGEKGGCCSCCDCWEKNKNKEVEVQESIHEI